MKAGYSCPCQMKYDELKNWINEYWGLTLIRCGGKDSKAYEYGNWKTGFILAGHFPRRGYMIKRYNTLSEIIVATKEK